MPPTKTSPFLQLPAEIRNHIYSYVLPTTLSHPLRGPVWLRGTTTILATTRQIYDEAIPLLYASNTFLIDVEWDRISFRYQWLLLPTGLVPSRRMTFPDAFAARNVGLMKRFGVRVHHVDSYTGMVKYNYGGQGLRDGLRGRVEELCAVLGEVEEVVRLRVELMVEKRDVEVGKGVLEPLLLLGNVRQVVCVGVEG